MVQNLKPFHLLEFSLWDISTTKTEKLYSRLNKEQDKAALLHSALHGDIFPLREDASFCWIFALIGRLTHAFCKKNWLYCSCQLQGWDAVVLLWFLPEADGWLIKVKHYAMLQQLSTRLTETPTNNTSVNPEALMMSQRLAAQNFIFEPLVCVWVSSKWCFTHLVNTHIHNPG